ncbi:MAG: Mur ligase domain-containing protein, partial [Planctomycetia bacterium]|nr:Mur ligase domain-containing protein [Planctomycetia bacterium]
MMKLSELLASVPSSRLVSGSADVSVGGVQHDSRRVGLGDLFVAVPGTKRDGCEFVTSAVAAGAAAVVAERGIAAHLGVPVADVPGARQAVALFAHCFTCSKTIPAARRIA